MCSKEDQWEDFVSFDDSRIDWEEIFGEDFVDDKEVVNGETSGCVGEKGDLVHKESDAGAKYLCPFCKKTLKTTSGFRGHVKRHNENTSVRAADHLVTSAVLPNSIDSSTNCESPAQTSKGAIREVRCYTYATLQSNFKLYFENAVKALKDSPSMNSRNSRYGQHGVEILDCVQNSISRLQQCKFYSDLQNKLWVTLTSGDKRCNSSARREEMWTEFNKHASCSAFQESGYQFIKDLSGEQAKPQRLYRMVFNSLVRKIFDAVVIDRDNTEIPCTSVNKEQVKLDTAEENVLRYIGGYLCRQIIAMCRRLGKAKHEIFLQCLQSFDLNSSHEGTSSLEYSRDWNKLTDRGGLFHVNDNFFLLLRKIEILIRGQFQTQVMLCYHDGDIREDLMENLEINKDLSSHWKKLAISLSDDLQSELFKIIARLYVSLRGHAFSKRLRELDANKRKLACNVKQALLKGLKNSKTEK